MAGTAVPKDKIRVSEVVSFTLSWKIVLGSVNVSHIKMIILKILMETDVFGVRVYTFVLHFLSYSVNLGRF